MFRWALIFVGSILMLDTVFASMVCNFNLGVILPAIIGLPLFCVGVFWRPCLVFFSSGWGRAVKWVLVGGYAVFLISFAIVASCIAGRIADEPDPGADAVIVLGAAVRGNVPSATLRARLDCAYDYLADNPETCVIVTGGMGSGENVTEAYASKEYLLQRGIAQERIYMEDQSTSTQENLENAKVILSEHFSDSPELVLVSSDFHLYRARLVAKKLGLDVETLGNPSLFYLVPNFYLREYVAILGYGFMGRMG